MFAWHLAFLIFLLAPCLSFANEPFSSEEEARDFFSNADNVAIVLRLNGGISLGAYGDLKEKYGSDDSADEIARQWRSNVEASDFSEYLVIRDLKGRLPTVFSMPNDFATQYRLDLGEPNLVFLYNENGDYSLNRGEAFPAEYFDDELIDSGIPALIDYIVDYVYFPVDRQ